MAGAQAGAGGPNEAASPRLGPISLTHQKRCRQPHSLKRADPCRGQTGGRDMGQTNGRFLRLSGPLLGVDTGEAARENKSCLSQGWPRRLAPTHRVGMAHFIAKNPARLVSSGRMPTAGCAAIRGGIQAAACRARRTSQTKAAPVITPHNAPFNKASASAALPAVSHWPQAS